jgi:hypothetical protein
MIRSPHEHLRYAGRLPSSAHAGYDASRLAKTRTSRGLALCGEEIDQSIGWKKNDKSALRTEEFRTPLTMPMIGLAVNETRNTMTISQCQIEIDPVRHIPRTAAQYAIIAFIPLGGNGGKSW